MAVIREALQAQDKMSSVLDKIYTKLDRLEGQSERAKKSLSIIGKIQVGQLLQKGLSVANNLITKSVEGINEQIRAQQRLQTIMSSNDATQAEIDGVKKLATEMEGLTTYQEETLQAGASELATYKISGQALQKMMGTLADYAAGQAGINASSETMVDLANQLGKAYDGNYGGLTKIGFIFSDAQKKIIETGNEMEKVQVITDVIGDSYGGLAKAMAATPEGKMVQMQNTLDSVADSIGIRVLPLIQSLMGKVAEIASSPAFAVLVDKLVSGLGTMLNMLGSILNIIMVVATFFAANWNIIAPILWGIVGALGAYAIGMGISAIATKMADFSAKDFFITLLKNPIMWIAILIGVVIAAVYKWIQSVGGLKIWWMIVMNAIKTAWDWVGIGLTTGIYWIIDKFDEMKLKIKIITTAIANFMGDLRANVLTILQNLINKAIDNINKFIGILNLIPGVNIDLIGHVEFGTAAQLENEANKQARNAELADYAAEIEAGKVERAAKLQSIKDDARSATAQREAEIAAARADAAKVKEEEKQATATDYVYKEGAGSVAAETIDVGEVEKPVEIKSEDLKILRELAEKETIVNLTSLAPQITVQVENTNGRLDTKKIIKAVDTYLSKEISRVPAGAYGLG